MSPAELRGLPRPGLPPALRPQGATSSPECGPSGPAARPRTHGSRERPVLYTELAALAPLAHVCPLSAACGPWDGPEKGCGKLTAS